MKPEKPAGKDRGDLPRPYRETHCQTALSPFARTELSDVFGMLKGKVAVKTDEEIASALIQDVRRKWPSRG